MQALPQRICPAGHTQAPPVHVAAAGQEVEQLPQCCGSVSKFTHAVGEAVGHGSGSDAGHLHVLPEQISPASGQIVPHAPQFDGSFVVFTQAVGEETGHSVGNDAGQPQTPAEQASRVSGQGCPQPPSPRQFFGSVWRFVQNARQSSGLAPPQSQIPDWQVEPGLVAVQDVVHEPHAPSSARRFRQRGTSRSQRVVPPPHWQRPPAQVAPAPQATPQAPQLAGSVWYPAGS
jgi:hypothetical protein